MCIRSDVDELGEREGEREKKEHYSRGQNGKLNRTFCSTEYIRVYIWWLFQTRIFVSNIKARAHMCIASQALTTLTLSFNSIGLIAYNLSCLFILCTFLKHFPSKLTCITPVWMRKNKKKTQKRKGKGTDEWIWWIANEQVRECIKIKRNVS